MRKFSASLAMAAVLALTACGGGSPSGGPDSAAPEAAGSGGLTSVNVGVIPIVDVAPTYLGVKEGIFEKAGLDVELTPAQGGAAIVPAIVNGQLDFGFSNVTSLIVARSKGLPLQILASGSSSTGDEDADFAAVMVMPDSGIEKIEDLAGKKIGVNTLNNISDSTIRTAVAESGADASSLEFVEIAFPDMQAALEKGTVDAIGAVEPFLTLAKEGGAVPVFSNYAYPVDDLTVAVYFTSEQTATQDPETTKAFAAAMKEAQAFADANPDKVRAILPEYTKLDAAIIDKLTLPKFTQDVNMDSLQTIADISLENGLIDELPDMKALMPGN